MRSEYEYIYIFNSKSPIFMPVVISPLSHTLITFAWCAPSGFVAMRACDDSRNTAMAAAANFADQERARPGRPLPAHISGHHCAQAAHRDRRYQRRY